MLRMLPTQGSAKQREIGARKSDFPTLKIFFPFLSQKTKVYCAKRTIFIFYTIQAGHHTQAVVHGLDVLAIAGW